MKIVRQEIFDPIISAMPLDTFDALIRLPFGVYKMGGHGRESGTEHLDHDPSTKSALPNAD